MLAGWVRAGLGAVLLAGCAAGAPGPVDSFDPAWLKAGVAPGPADCGPQATAVWITVASRGDCIRYFHAGLGTASDNGAVGQEADHRPALVWFHGDRLVSYWGNGGPRRVEVCCYGDNDPAVLAARAERRFRQSGLPFIHLSRPGVYGSSGDHKARRRPREIALIDAALDRIKARHDLRDLVLAGQSGGGHVVAALLARRNDIRCAVIASGVVAVRLRIAAKGWETDATGYDDYLDPITEVAAVPYDPRRRVFVIADPADRVVPFATQRAYAEALVRAGHRAWLIEARGRGADRHGLGEAAQTLARWCAEGVPTGAILRRARAWRGAG